MSKRATILEPGHKFPRHEEVATIAGWVTAGRAKWIIPNVSALYIFHSTSIPYEARNVPNENLPPIELPGVKFQPPLRRVPSYEPLSLV